MEFTSKIKSFLKLCKKRLESNELLICLGNEAYDTDSFISSLVIALHEKAIFVVNMSKRIIENKGDIMYVCKYIGIELDDLIFLETPLGIFSHDARKLATYLKVGNQEYYLSNKRISLILVDHHRPILELDNCDIDLIVDHHLLSAPSLKARRIYVDVDIGSCATLVSKYIGHSLFKKKHNKHSEFESMKFCMGIAKLLTIPIILDTNNFKKVTCHFDKGEFKKLKALSKSKRREIYKTTKDIKAARKNDIILENDMILLKDMKRYEHKGFVSAYSTISYKFEKWVDREAKKLGMENSKDKGNVLEMAFKSFKRENGCDFILIGKVKKIKDILL